MSDQSDLNRAARARELLENPLLIEALAEIEKEVIETWTKTGAGQSEDRERLFLILKAKQKFVLMLESWVNTGKLISLQATPVERLRRAVGLR